MNPQELTQERQSTHGDWVLQSQCSYGLKNCVRSYAGFTSLTPSQQEAIDMILHKVSRIVNGNPNFPDHWDDIQGYAHLGKTGGHTPKSNKMHRPIRNEPGTLGAMLNAR